MAEESNQGASAPASTETNQQTAPTGENITSPKESVPAKEIKAEQPKSGPKEYIGSEKVNPEQRPLKQFKRDGMSKEQIDALIKEAGEEIFLKEEPKKEKEGEEKKPEAEDKKDGDKTEAEDDEVKDFLEKSGLSKEEAAEIPESAIGKIQKMIAETGTKGKEYKELNDKYTQLKTDSDTLLKDSVVAARAEELATGKSFVAKQIPPLTTEDIDKIEELAAGGDKQGIKDYVDNIIKIKAQDAIKHERAVIDRKIYNEKLDHDSFDVVRELGKIDKRLAIKETSLEKISKEGHEEHKTAKEIIDFLKENGYSKEQIVKLGAKKIYAVIATERGWDKEAARNIEENTKKTLFEKLRKPAKADSLDMGQPSGNVGESFGNSGFSKNQLIDQISKGSLENYNKLLQAADATGDNKMVRLLGEIQRAGQEKARNKNEE